MPIHKVPGGYKWGGHGKVYKTRAGAERQAAAAFANGYKGKKKGGLVEGQEKKTSTSASTSTKKPNRKRPKNA